MQRKLYVQCLLKRLILTAHTPDRLPESSVSTSSAIRAEDGTSRKDCYMEQAIRISGFAYLGHVFPFRHLAANPF